MAKARSTKIKQLTDKQKQVFFKDRTQFIYSTDLYLSLIWIKKIKSWVEANQYYVTRIVYSDNINQSKLDQVTDIASRCGKLRQALWNKYGSLQAWGRSTIDVRQEAKVVFPPDTFGLSYKVWEATVMDVIDDIHACQEAAKTYVIRTIYRQLKDEDKRKELIAKLKTTEFLSHPWLRQLVRKQYKRGHTYVDNQIVLNPDLYSVERGKDGMTWVNVPSLIPRQRIPLRFLAGKNTISGRIRLILRFGLIELHFPRLTWKQPNTSTETIGVDKGYTEVFYSSENRAYGQELGQTLTKETEYRHIKGQRRNKLHALARNTKDEKKSARIKKNNLGTIKQKRRLNAAQSTIKSIVGISVKQVFNDAKTVVCEDLTQPIKSKRQSKKLNRKLSNWTKGVVAKMVENTAIRRCSTVIVVNCAFSSQVDYRNGRS